MISRVPMSCIYKYDLPLPSLITGAVAFVLDLPRGAQLLAFMCQRNAPKVWARVDPEAPTERREFLFCGTGHGIPDLPYRYFGTTQTSDGGYVWHLFERYSR